jgi:glucose/arabinose dehydrogenase
MRTSAGYEQRDDPTYRDDALEVNGDQVTGQEVIFDQFGRVRDVVQGPNG